jgi:hypothetical protein
VCGKIVAMSILTDFFVAEEAEIASIVSGGPADQMPTVQESGVDDVKLATLNGIATGRDYSTDGGFDHLLEEVEEVTSKGNDGPWVFAVPAALVAALRSASAERLVTIADEWAATEEWMADGVPADDLRPLLHDLASLARSVEPPKRLYVWISL